LKVVQLNGGGHKVHNIIIITADLSATVVIARRLRRFGYDMIYLTAIGLTPGGSGTVHIYTEYRDGTYITLKKLNIHNNQKIN
jgi:hypothetical protein